MIVAPHGLCMNCRNIIDAVIEDHTEQEAAYRLASAEGLLHVPAVALSYARADRIPGTNRITKQPRERAEIELAQRVLRRRRLLPYIEHTVPEYKAGWVHKDICQRLERFTEQVENEESPRLMLFMPPRHGKSQIASVNYPAWYLGRNPRHEIIACSYSSALAMKFSRRVRSQLKSREYKATFPDTSLDPTSSAAEEWMTTAGGSYLAAGVDGSITGKGAHVLIIDDPVKNAVEADSEVTQENIAEWYSSVAYTRLAPGAGVLLIMTRWHDADLGGYLLQQQEEGADQWDVILYPAIATEDEKYRKKGDCLHAARFDDKALARIKKQLPTRNWQALYQQKPVADEGAYFRRDDFKYYNFDELDLFDCAVYQAWDFAIGEKEQNDYSVGAALAVDKEDNYYILDIVRGRWGGMDLVERVLDFYAKWEPGVVGIERGHISMAIGPFLNKRIAERGYHKFSIEELSAGRQDKMLRARSAQGRLQQGRLLMPKDALFVDDLVSEMLRFPYGVNDDQVDAIAWLCLMMDNFTPLSTRKEKKKASWRDKLKIKTKATGAGAMSA